MPRKPRINVAVTKEQHALLLELAELQGGSAAGYLRQQLDASTPLLRVAVPMLRRAAQEIELTKAEAAKILKTPLEELRKAGVLDQMDLLDVEGMGVGARPQRSERPSERGREEPAPMPFPDDCDDG